MSTPGSERERDLERRLAEAEATIEALLSGQIDAVVEPSGHKPLLLHRAQQALSDSEAQYRQIVEATSDGILKLDMAAQIVFANGRLAQMLGYAPPEMIGLGFHALLVPRPEGETPHLDAWPARGIDARVLQKDGDEIALTIAITRLTDEGGRRLGYLGVLRDDPEKQKRQSQRLFKERLASVGTLAGGVAHEINSPLAAVIANLDFLTQSLSVAEQEDRSRGGASGASDPTTSNEIRAALADARVAAERVRHIVRDLQLLARSPDRESTGRVDVEATLESSLKMVSKELRNRARLVKRYGGVPHVMANAVRLRQVFLNLLINAAQALPEGQPEHNEVHVRTSMDGERAVVEVSDTGPGIPREILHRIFDAFFTTKPVGVGTGLGLAVCQRLVAEMSGELTVESEPGQGATFRLALPVARD